MLRNPVVGRVCAIADQDHSYVRGIWRPDGARAVRDHENIKPKACRHAVDFLPHRARITVDVDLSQLPARFRLNPMERISEVTHTSVDEMCSTIQSSAASALSPTRIILTFEIPGGRIGLDPLETRKH